MFHREVGSMRKKIMVQLSFIGSPYYRVCEIYRLLDTIGIDVMILPNTDNGKMAVLIIPKNDLIKARKSFDRLDIHAQEKEVLVVHVENDIGRVADISRKIGDSGISINYAFLGHISISEAYLILECTDNKMALRALDGKPFDNPDPMKP